VGSLSNGGVWRGDVRTGRGAVFVPGAGPAAVGVEYEHHRDRIWVAGGDTGAVRVYDARNGSLLATYQFPGAGFLNDLVATDDAVYVTDSFVPRLAVIPLGRHGRLPAASDVETLALSGDVHFVEGEFNANGIVATGRSLVLVQSNTGQLFRVDPDSGAAAEIDLGGQSVTFGDGLELHGSTLYVVRNQLNLVAVYRLHRGLDSARFLGDLTSPELDVPTTAAFTAGRLWAVNARFTTPVTPDTTYSITRLPARP
jgi:hypothetical protein